MYDPHLKSNEDQLSLSIIIINYQLLIINYYIIISKSLETSNSGIKLCGIRIKGYCSYECF